jgi:hypothetical protein
METVADVAASRSKAAAIDCGISGRTGARDPPPKKRPQYGQRTEAASSLRGRVSLGIGRGVASRGARDLLGRRLFVPKKNLRTERPRQGVGPLPGLPTSVGERGCLPGLLLWVNPESEDIDA